MKAIAYPTLADLHERVQPSRTTAERFARGYVSDPTGCWRWIKGKTTSGYGHFSIRGVYYQAHKIAYILHGGHIPPAFELDHLCRHRWCVNPAHLEPVTHKTNVRRGSSTRLTPERVEAIRRAVTGGLSYRQVGPRFGVDYSTVSRIMTGTRWSDTRAEVAA